MSFEKYFGASPENVKRQLEKEKQSLQENMNGLKNEMKGKSYEEGNFKGIMYGLQVPLQLGLCIAWTSMGNIPAGIATGTAAAASALLLYRWYQKRFNGVEVL